MKRCTKCGQEKSETAFSKRKASRDGLAYECKACQSKYHAIWLATPEGKAAATAARKAYRQTENGRAKSRDSNAAYRRTPKGLKKESDRQRASVATEEGRAKHNKSARAWRKTPEGHASIMRAAHKRRGHLDSVDCTLIAKEWAQIQEQQNHTCIWCGEQKKLTMDHIIPVSKGGRHVKGNIQGLCRSCNSRKGNRMPSEIEKG